MDLLEEYVADNNLTRENILKYVDDYSIYSFYIGYELELRTKYSSPLRDGDEDPSFSLFYSKFKTDSIWFKDSAKGLYGDVFTFLKAYLGFSYRNVLLQINHDFGLGLSGEDMGEFKPQLIKSKPLKKEPVQIKITKKFPVSQTFKDYWEFLGISESTLKRYYVSEVEIIHYINSVDHNTKPAVDLTIAYEIVGTYKLYRPFAEKKSKFRNNFLDNYVEGALQLTFSTEFCVITKSLKECMFMFEHFKWEAVAGKSETTKIPEFFVRMLLAKYKKVFVWLDNDDTGRKSQLEYVELYPELIPVNLPSSFEQTDPTDVYTDAKKVGNELKALEFLYQIINSKL